MTATRILHDIARYAGALLLFLAISGCGGGNPISPGPGNSPAAPQMNADISGVSDGRISWGMWNITIDPVNMTATVVPLREGEIHYNVLHMLEGWACKNCVGIQNLDWDGKNKMLVDIFIRHPYDTSRLDLTGRDVRGIVIFDATTSFPYHTVRNAAGIDTPILASRRLLNADGYTTHFNRWTAHEGKYLTDYRRGRFAPAGEINIVGNLHPFKNFYTHEYKRLFYPGFAVTRTYELAIDKFKPFTFAYSVDASWNMPHTWPVIDPITAFDISTSSREAFQISMSIVDNQLTRQAGHADLLFDIFDHQGYESISTITIEAPDLFDGLVAIDPDAPAQIIDPESTRYQVTVNNTLGHAKTAEGGSDLLIVVEDVDMSVVGEDVKAYDIYTLPVTDPPKKWRPRDGTFQNLPFPGPAPNAARVDMSVIADPPWEITPGEPMLLFNDDVQEKYLGYNGSFTDYVWLAGYPGTTPSFLNPVQRLDAAVTGGFGVVSSSTATVSGQYQIRNCANMHAPGGIYIYSWYTGSLSDPIPHLELAADVSGGFGSAPGDPVYSMYLFDPASGPVPPSYESLHRVESPYNDPGGILRAFVPLTSGLSGTTPPFGVSYNDFVAMGIDDHPVTTLNPYTVHVYAAENRHTPPTMNLRELDIYEVNFTDPDAPKRLRTYNSSLLGISVVSSVDQDPRLVDVACLPAWANNVYKGDGEFAKNNWIAVLYTYDGWSRWFVEIFDARFNDPTATGWKEPIYVIGPYTGIARAIDVDPQAFEIYVLHNDAPLGSGALRLTCLEYY